MKYMHRVSFQTRKRQYFMRNIRCAACPSFFLYVFAVQGVPPFLYVWFSFAHRSHSMSFVLSTPPTLPVSFVFPTFLCTPKCCSWRFTQLLSTKSDVSPTNPSSFWARQLSTSVYSLLESFREYGCFILRRKTACTANWAALRFSPLRPSKKRRSAV